MTKFKLSKKTTSLQVIIKIKIKFCPNFQNTKIQKSIEIMTAFEGLAGSSRIPGPHDKVYKDECFFSFDNPVSISIIIFSIEIFFQENPYIFEIVFCRNLPMVYMCASILFWDLERNTL